MYGQDDSKSKQIFSRLFDKAAYAIAILVGIGFLWLVISLLGWWGFVVLMVLSVAITAFKVGFLWFLR